jgi:hypothetical protein
MKPEKFFTVFLILFAPVCTVAQTISASLPHPIVSSQKYLFYLHGAVVTELGNNAINRSVPEWGPYEYLNILDSLKKRGINVISEQRKKGVADSVYVVKIALQIDSLLRAGVKTKNIIVVGASAGWDIGLRVSARLKNDRLHFVAMGGCWPETCKDFVRIELYGHFLSIIENTDPHGTCYRLFNNRKFIKSYREIVLHTGLSHGFLYKGYKEWIDPVMAWFNDSR